MKIIKENKIVEKETKKTCYECKTKFSYVATDIEIDREGRYVKCPSCKVFIAV